MALIDSFFKMLNEYGGSDLHLSVGSVPIIRLHGKLTKVRYHELGQEELTKLLYEIAPEPIIKTFEETGDVDFGYEVPGLARYRGNLFRQDRGIAAVFREIPRVIRTIEELGMPPTLNDLAMLPKGLVLVTGPTGSGKSTTLAAMLDHANRHRRDHIITIEDPIEFVHQSKECLINQREVGRHTRSFTTALRGALREDPDIILVGEMRDLETIQLALEAAETGHLVLATLHTLSAAKTIDRIVEVFPADMQSQIRTSLAESIQAIVAQVLFRRADEQGRVAALEIALGVTALRSMIREHKTHQIASLLQTSKNQGMLAMDDELIRLITSNIINPADALPYASDKQRVRNAGRG